MSDLKTSARIALMSLSVTTTFGTMMAAPAVKLLAAAFPNTDPLLVQWVVTISSLFILPTLFMAESLGRRFGRKRILLAGLLLYVTGGVGPAFAHSFGMILGFRAILGLSIGLISPTFNTLIAESFQGQARSRMNGIQTSVNGIAGAIFLSAGGFIASLGWRDVFLTYFYAVGLLILVAAFLPKFPPIQANKASVGSVKLPRFFYAVALAGGLHTMLFALIPTNLSLFLADNGIGSVASAGYLTAIALTGVFAGGLSVTRLQGLFKKRLVPVTLTFMAFGFVMLGTAQSEWTVALSLFMIGLAESVLFPLSLIKTAEVVPGAGLARAISFMLAIIYLCQFLTPLFLRGMELLLRTDSTRSVFMTLAAALVVTACLFVPAARSKRMDNRMASSSN